MKRTGFTLIELMIVVAVLGILFKSIYPGLQAILDQNRHQEAVLHDSAGLTRLYGLMKAELRLCQTVESADEKGVRFAGNRSIDIIDGGRQIRVGQKLIRLEGGARCWGFEKVDERCFSSQIRNGPDDIRVIWRTGASE